MALAFKNKKETLSMNAHIDVIENGIYIGYMIHQDKWYFVCESNDRISRFYNYKKCESMSAETKQQLINKMETAIAFHLIHD